MTNPDDYDEHCHGECESTYDEGSGDIIDDGLDCAHCECCGCLACEYGPKDGMLLTEAQRASIAAHGKEQA